MEISNDCFVVCPYCGHQHAEAWEICKDESVREYDCQECERTFNCWAVETIIYHSESTYESESKRSREAKLALNRWSQ